MPHDTALILTIAGGIGLAFVLGLAVTRVRLPPLVGYLLAGVLVGPFTPGFVADTGLAQQLAEIGVILLMFGVGIHFSLADLLAVRRIALPGALVQISVATAMGAGMARLWGWTWGSGLVFGLCLSVASTVVLLRALEARGLVDSPDGRIAIGWLIVEDLVTVLVLVLLPALAVPLGGTVEPAAGAPSQSLPLAIASTLLKVAAFVALMLVVGRRFVPWLLHRVARTGSRELFTLCVLAVALGTAVGASVLFGVSFALGAFFAGMVVNSSDLSHEAATESLPLRDAFSVLFFVAVGMLFDPSILVTQPLQVLAVVLIVLIGKSLAALGIVVLFRYPMATALTIAASLAQIGEFSFILAALAMSLGLLTAEAQSLIVAGSLISITLNPIAFGAITRLASRRDRAQAAKEAPAAGAGGSPEGPATTPVGDLHDHVIVVGYGRVGSAIRDTLERRGVAHVIVDQSRPAIEDLQDKGVRCVQGDATRPEILREAGIERARLVVVATPEPYQARAIIDVARAENPRVQTAARTDSEAERSYLESHGAHVALVAEHELALALGHHALMRMGCARSDADAAIEEARRSRPFRREGRPDEVGGGGVLPSSA